MADLPSFEIHVEPGFRDCTVRMNGIDITDGITLITVNHEVNPTAIPEVVLGFRANKVDITGDGKAFAELNGKAIAELLDQVDPKELEAAALERSGYGGNVTQATLDVLKEQLGVES